MEYNYIGFGIKAFITAAGTWLSMKLGALYPVMLVLLAVMSMDFITAWARAIVTDEKLQSRKCVKGVAKKVLYLAGVCVGLVLDYLISPTVTGIPVDTPVSFGLLVAIWLILGDLVSILENIGSAGVRLPKALLKLVQLLQAHVESQDDGK